MVEVSKEQAERLLSLLHHSLSRIDNEIDNIDEYLTLIINSRTWEILGYPTAEEMFIDRGLDKYRLTKGVRARVVQWLKDGTPNISNRRVADILGVSSKTVDRDVAATFVADVDHDNEDVSATYVPPQPPKSEESKAKPILKPKIQRPVSVPEKIIEGTVEPRPPIPRCPTCGKPS